MIMLGKIKKTDKLRNPMPMLYWRLEKRQFQDISSFI